MSQSAFPDALFFRLHAPPPEVGRPLRRAGKIPAKRLSTRYPKKVSAMLPPLFGGRRVARRTTCAAPP